MTVHCTLLCIVVRAKLSLSLVFLAHIHTSTHTQERVFTAPAPPPPTHTLLTARSISWIEWPQKPEKQLPSASNWMCIDECRQFKEFAMGISHNQEKRSSPNIKWLRMLSFAFVYANGSITKPWWQWQTTRKKSSSLTTKKKGLELLSLTHSWCKLRLWNNKHRQQ